MREKVKGFAPIFRADSEILILGTMPSIISRREEFYYGNKRNRFWKTISKFFGREEPQGREEKISLLLDNKIALWDVLGECEIEGSKDHSIREPKYNDIRGLLKVTAVKIIVLNGKKAFELYKKGFPDVCVECVCAPSTSPANVTFDENVWFDILRHESSKR